MTFLHSSFHFDEIIHPEKKLMKILWSGAARRVAITLLALFSSIYIYQVFVESGSSSTGAILAVVLFHFILRLSKLITLVFAEDLSRRVGFVRTLKVSIVPFLLFIYILLHSAGNPTLFYLAAFLWGVHAGLYWWGFHGYFVKTQDKKHFGREIGEVQFLRTAAAIATPFLGGLVINYFGFSSAFVLAGVFMVLAVIIFDSKEEISQETDTSFKEVLSLIKKHKSTSLSYAGIAAEGVVYTVAWPLFLFFVFGDVLSLGEIISLAALIAAVFSVFVGDWVDRQGERRALFLGTPINTLSWFVRILGNSFGFFVAADTARNFGQKITNLTLTELSYKKAIKKVSARAILFRETALILGDFVALFIIGSIVYLGGSIEQTFVFAAFFAALPLLPVIRKKI